MAQDNSSISNIIVGETCVQRVKGENRMHKKQTLIVVFKEHTEVHFYLCETLCSSKSMLKSKEL